MRATAANLEDTINFYLKVPNKLLYLVLIQFMCMQYQIKIVSSFSDNIPTEGRFSFLHENRKSAVGPDFHPALIVN